MKGKGWERRCRRQKAEEQGAARGVTEQGLENGGGGGGDDGGGVCACVSWVQGPEPGVESAAEVLV